MARLFFSYPGYNETLCGFADPRTKSNDNIPNPNVTVLGWLRNRPTFQGDIGAFGAWEVIAAVFNPECSKITASAGWDSFAAISMTPRLELLNHLQLETPHVWDHEPFDAIPFYTAVEYLQQRSPQFCICPWAKLTIGPMQGDIPSTWTGRHRVDAYLKSLWELAQSMPEYRGNTTLIFSPDHGRGKSPHKWKDHGKQIPDSKYIWMAFLGLDTPALGERSNSPAVTQSQIAATFAAFLSEHYAVDVPKAGKSIGDVLAHHCVEVVMRPRCGWRSFGGTKGCDLAGFLKPI